MFMDLIMFSDVAVFKPVVQVTTLYPYDWCCHSQEDHNFCKCVY
jgi:hypothetical protein